MKYRAEINGLRALAVVPVILFHAGFDLFGGGFVGVDVFFVISGYLVTTILIEDIESKGFSIVNFYERRARRILPALFFVMIVCIPFAWIWMVPSQWKDFSKSLVAVSIFAANILFWRESGYFDATAEEKPLLHTWSLAVEEQYYVLFPVFLLVAWRFGKNRVFWMIFVIAAISLLLSEYGWRKHPNANFYLAPTRVWELLAGSIAAFLAQRQGVQTNNVLASLGLVAILFSIFFYDERTPFPSLYALVPVLGTVLLVLYANEKTIVAKLLSRQILVRVGLISYSAYLWHQPLFAFARIKLVDHPSSVVMGSLAAASFILAFASWKYVEEPFRRKGVLQRKTIFIWSVAAIVVFLSFGLLGHKNIIKSYREISTNSLLGDIEKSEYGGIGFEWVDLVKKPKALIVGDSHAKQYIKAARELDPNVSLIAEPACLSLPNLINEYDNKNITRHKCIRLYQKYLGYLNANPTIETLFFSHSWGKNLFDLESGTLLGQATDSSVAFERLSYHLNLYFRGLATLNIKIVIIGNVPTASAASEYMKKGYLDCIYNYGYKSCPKTYSRNLRVGQRINALLSQIASKYENIYFLDPAEHLCSETECFIVRENKLLYSDHGHLTTLGARLVINDITTVRLNR